MHLYSVPETLAGWGIPAEHVRIDAAGKRVTLFGREVDLGSECEWYRGTPYATAESLKTALATARRAGTVENARAEVAVSPGVSWGPEPVNALRSALG